MNFNPLFLLWTLFWGTLAFILGSWGLFIVALLPWMVFAGVIALAMVMIYVGYRKGIPTTITTKNTRRVYRRGQPTIIERFDNEWI